MAGALEVEYAAVARLIGDRTRAAFLDVLMDTPPRSLTELARKAGVTPATASVHLSKLVDGGLVTSTRRGRNRHFELAGPSVAAALEALSLVAPPRPIRSLREASIREALLAARTCYDHIAGQLGVRLTDALLADGILARNGEGFVLTTKGRARFEEFGLDIPKLERKRRPLARACLDWTERRHHLAGALGAALAAELFHRRWVVRSGHGRAVRLTAAGTRELADEFGLDGQRTFWTDRVI
jgi:DNA-binding transcriptional ArsR family regulator